MRILLSGSHGFIGTALTRRLEEDGHVVVRMVRAGAGGAAPDVGAPAGPTPSAGPVLYDPLSNANAVDLPSLEASGPYDAAVHLAGAGIGDRRWTKGRKRVVVDSRLRPTAAIAGALAGLRPPPAVLVSASAVGWYGDRADEELTEDSGPGSGFLAELCRRWEEATAAAGEAGIRVVHLRSGIVLSPAGGVLLRLLPLAKLGIGGRLGSGRQFVSWISLGDEVAAVRFALADERLDGPLNAVAPDPVPNAELSRQIAAAVHRRRELPVPAPLLRLATGREMADELLLASQRALPARLVQSGFSFSDPELGPALQSMLGRIG